jgi:hypothetical protein
MILNSFKRFEKKYLLDGPQRDSILSSINEHMSLDEHNRDGELYTLYNLYFDTDHYDLIRASIGGPYYKEKLRLRSYKSMDDGSNEVFIEIKKKIGGIVSKRRTSIPLSDAMRFAETGLCPNTDNYIDHQILSEIQDLLTRYELSPKWFIRYERLAYIGNEDKSLRVTFDQNIYTHQNGANNGFPLLSDEKTLMEIKFSDTIPIWLARALSETKIFPTHFSKYGQAYEKYLKSNLRRSS